MDTSFAALRLSLRPRADGPTNNTSQTAGSGANIDMTKEFIPVESAIQGDQSAMAGCERIIESLAAGAARSKTEVERLFAAEYARLAATARIRVHLPALVASNVRSMLRQPAPRTAAA